MARCAHLGAGIGSGYAIPDVSPQGDSTMANDANGAPHNAESTVAEAYGASQIGPFDYCPKLGFREYWYPAVEARKVRGKPVSLMMLGDDLVLFRDAAGRVAALSDWCPHRG